MEICDNDRLYLYADVHILRGCYEEEMHMNIGVVWLLDVNAKCLINLWRKMVEYLYLISI